MSFKPLEGMTIIDLSHRLPGPLCGKILTDLGAIVIKIEDHFFRTRLTRDYLLNSIQVFYLGMKT